MDTLTSLINQLVTSGGIGFINLFLLIRLDYINFSKENKEDKYLYLLFFSIVNYSIYLLIVEISKYFSLPIELHIPVAIFLVLILSIIFTFILSPLIFIIISSFDVWAFKKLEMATNNKNIFFRINFDVKIN